jgi:serine/threonine-protein kinase
MSGAAGKVIADRYELIEKVGEGGMAYVWRARMHGALGFSRPVAVKEIKREYRAMRNYIDMFIEEARVGSELAHPNIVQIFDFCVEEDETHYLVMEWVEGCDLDTWVRTHFDAGERTPWSLAVAVGIGTLRGLAAAHGRRSLDGEFAPVIHRDISPHNVLLGSNGIVKLTDFGLSKARDRIFSLTAPGTVKGKLSYLSPEVTLGRAATPQSDIFSMGSVLWEALSGKRLFDAASDLEVFKKIRNCVVRPLARERPDIPESLVEVIHTALAKSLDERYSNAREMATALAMVLRDADPDTDAIGHLGHTVIKARRRAGLAATSETPPEQISESTWTFDVEVESVVTDSLPVGDEEDIELSDTGAWEPHRSTEDSGGSIEIEFSEVASLPDPKKS